MSKLLRGLYAITDPQLCRDQLVAQVSQAIAGGAQIIQYRNKMAGARQKLAEARQLKELCEQQQRLLIINDDVELAMAVDADGVHIGQSDMALANARKLLGNNKIIGVTCNNQLPWAIEARRQGADYIALGRFFSSNTKPDAPAASIDLLTQARQQLDIPIVAIGGITAANAQQLIEAGADMLAVIHAIFAQPNIKTAAEQIQQHFKACA
jgi:thiamine-phosphate pyrophosphorylase